MYDKGNHDYVKGCLTPKGFHKWDLANPSRIGIEKHQILMKEWKEINKGRTYTTSRQIAYCELGSRGHGGWHFQRKQNTSSFMRRRYKSMVNKKTRQYLHDEMMKEYNDLDII